jgi:DNA-directed RNA polymerase specialized sigma24 family protein
MSETTSTGDDARTTDDESLTDKYPVLEILSEAELEAYEAVDLGTSGVREFARETDRKPGTISTLLRRARRKVKLEALDTDEVAFPGEGSA